MEWFGIGPMKQFPCTWAKMAQALSEEEFHRMQVAQFLIRQFFRRIIFNTSNFRLKQSHLSVWKIKDRIIAVQSGRILLTTAVVIEGGVILLASVSFLANNLTLLTIQLRLICCTLTCFVLFLDFA